MSDTGILQLIATLLGALATVVMSLEQRFVRDLRRREATSAESAVTIGEPGLITRWRMRRLARAGALRETGSGAVYLDEAAYRALRRRRVLTVIPLVVGLVGLVLILRALR